MDYSTKFRHWLEEKKKSQQTISKYVNNIEKISKELSEHDKRDINLFQISNPSEIKYIKEYYLSINKFKEKDVKHHRESSSALSNYKLFLENLEVKKRGFIGVTTREWFEYIRENKFEENVNFWRKNTNNFNVINEGEPFFFLVKNYKGTRTERAVLGYGIFKNYAVLETSEAWEKYKHHNGVPNKEEFLKRMDVMFKKDVNSKIGSIILSNLVFFNSPVYLSKIGIEFPNSIVSGKSINSSEVQAILTKGLARTSDLEKTLKENIENSQVGFTEDDLSFPEGRLKLKQHLIRERNPKVIKTAKNKFKEKHGRVFCEVCNFDFEKHYGEIGEDYIEGHHIKPVSELKEGEETKIEDIKLVCSNCHRMLHRKRPWLKVEELKKLFNENN